MEYKESKQLLNKIRSNNELLFRMSVSHLIDVGVRNLTPEKVEATCSEILKQDDSQSVMTNNVQCEIVRTAGELAKIDHIHLLVYIQQEVLYDVGQKEMSYDRAIQLLQRAIEWIAEYGTYEATILRDALVLAMGFDQKELEQLGYGYLIEEF